MIKEFCRKALLLVASVSLALGLSGVIVPMTLGNIGSQALANDHHVSWQTSLAAGSEQARRENKYVLADVFTVWCGWCKKLDKDVFPDSELASYLQKDFICVKVNAEDPKEGAPVAQAYKVHGYPCSLIFSPDGRLIGRVPGYMAAKPYLMTLQHMREQGDQAQTQPVSQLSQEPTLRPVMQQVQNPQQQQMRQQQFDDSQKLQQQQQLKQLDMFQKQWQEQNQQQQQQQTQSQQH
jgi:thioredoxin-related protein